MRECGKRSRSAGLNLRSPRQPGCQESSARERVRTLLPILRKMRDCGRPLRVLIVLEPDFAEEPGAVWEGLKADIEFGVFLAAGMGALRNRERSSVGG